MLRKHRQRRKAFKVALAYAGKTAKQFAVEHNVGEVHLHAVLRGDRESAPLEKAIAAFIEKHSRKLTAAAS